MTTPPRLLLVPLLLLAVLSAVAACVRTTALLPVATTELPRRIAAMTCNALDVLAVLGELDRVVAVEEDCPVAGTEDKVHIRNDDHAGKQKGLNLEAVLAVQPDLVIVKPALQTMLHQCGVRILELPRNQGPEAIPELTRRIADAVGNPGAERVLLAMQAKEAALRRKTADLPRVRVYYEGTGLGRTVGRGSVLHAMLELAGGDNIAGEVDQPAVTLTSEAILAADPEVIVLSPFADPPAAIAARPGWSRLRAVQNHRVHVIPVDRRYVLLATPRCVDGCAEFLLPWLHPELTAGQGH